MKFKHFKEQFSKVVSSPFRQDKRGNSVRHKGLRRAQSAMIDKNKNLMFESSFSRIQRKGSELRLDNKTGKTMETAATMASKVSAGEGIKENYSIEKVKVYVFYTKKHEHTNIFANTELDFNLSIGGERFSGRSLTLQELKNKETCQRHSS